MRHVKLKVLAVAACVAATAPFLLSQTKADPLDPVVVAGDTHKLAFENTFVRVLDVHLPPGKIEPRHHHPHGLSVYFSDWDAKVQVDGAAAETRHRQNGTFAWNEAVIHTVQNVGKTEGHILRVELKF